MNPFLAEFFGTMLLILIGDGVVAAVSLKNTKAENAGYMMVSLAWGLAVMLAIYAVGQISGAHLNPAVTIALTIAGDFPVENILGYCAAQVAGAFSGAVLVYFFYLPHWPLSSDPAAKLGIFCTTPAIRSAPNNLFSEVIATMVLILGLLFIGANKFSEGLNPIAVGALITAIGFSLGSTTGFAINPARDLGPRVAHAILPIPGKGGSDWAYSWIPIVGPLIGCIAAAYLHKILF